MALLFFSHKWLHQLAFDQIIVNFLCCKSRQLSAFVKHLFSIFNLSVDVTPTCCAMPFSAARKYLVGVGLTSVGFEQRNQFGCQFIFIFHDVVFLVCLSNV